MAVGLGENMAKKNMLDKYRAWLAVLNGLHGELEESGEEFCTNVVQMLIYHLENKVKDVSKET